MKVEDLCSSCAAPRLSNEHQNMLVPFGDSDRKAVPVGKRGHYLEVTQSYKCPKCGAIWENLIESGAGGHGNFWNRIDPPRSK